MDYLRHADPEMRELMELLGAAAVPRHKRRAVVRTNRHVPYYTKGRYARI